MSLLSQQTCLCDETCKEQSDILGIYMQNIQQLAVCSLETQFCPYMLTCFSCSGVQRPVTEGLYDNLIRFYDVWSVQTRLIQWSLRIWPGMYTIQPLE